MSDSHPILMVVAAVVVRDGCVLLTRRNAGSHLAGHWEFPGGKVEAGEDPPAALARELREELGVEATVGAPFAFNYHEYADRRVLLLAYFTEIDSDPQPLACADLGWFHAAQIDSLAMPEADVPILARLLPILSPC